MYDDVSTCDVAGRDDFKLTLSCPGKPIEAAQVNHFSLGCTGQCIAWRYMSLNSFRSCYVGTLRSPLSIFHIRS